MSTDAMTSPSTNAAVQGWTVTFQSTLALGQDPRELMQALSKGAGGADAMVRADFDWSEPHALQAWISEQPAAMLADLYATTILALQTNRAAVNTFRQGLAHVLRQPAISLGALGFLHGSLSDSVAKAGALSSLAKGLYAGCLAAGLPVTAPQDNSDIAQWAGDAVLDRADATIGLDPSAAGRQLEEAMASITGLGEADDIPDDGRSPYEEIASVFSLTSQ